MHNLPISVTSVRDELSGSGMDFYLSRMGDEAYVEGIIKKAIREAVSQVEINCSTRLIQRKFKSRPLEPGMVRGTDYDEAEDAYDYYRHEFDGWGSFRTKVRPIVSVERIAVRYGSENRTLKVVEFPDNWIMKNTRMGIVNIVPLIGLTSSDTVSLLMVPLIGLGATTSGMIPLIVGIDYTAGFLPPEFDPDADDNENGTTDQEIYLSDPRVQSPDQDVVALLGAVRYIATAKMLGKLQRAVGAGGGSVAIDGLSQSYQPSRFMQDIKDYEEKADNIQRMYKANYAPPKCFVM